MEEHCGVNEQSLARLHWRSAGIDDPPTHGVLILLHAVGKQLQINNRASQYRNESTAGLPRQSGKGCQSI
jgi:hypothetical protein